MRIVKVQIDENTGKLLARLRRQTGMTNSQLVRRALELVRQLATPLPVRGVGEFASGHRDLATNKKHLAGFGQS